MPLLIKEISEEVGRVGEILSQAGEIELARKVWVAQSDKAFHLRQQLQGILGCLSLPKFESSVLLVEQGGS